jgi:kynurenine formamidase
VLLTLQYSTQWDSFAHIGSRFDADGDGRRETVFYNGFRGGQDVVPASQKDSQGWDRFEGTQAKALGIENLAEHGAQGRGVLIDLHHHFQRKRHPLRADELLEILKKDKVEVQKGDMVCFYTGFGDVIMEQKKSPDAKVMHGVCSGLDGRDPKILEWVSDSGLACLIADNYAVELIPSGMDFSTPHAAMPLHEHCLFKNGIHLGEMFWLSDLARWLREHKRSRFLLTAPPLRLPGAVGSPSSAIATV